MTPPLPDAETALAGRAGAVGPDLQRALAAYPLDGIDTEFPHHSRRLESPEGPERPRERHPIFHGCYDWHSAVHGHWSLVRQLRLFEDHPDRERIGAALADRFVRADAEREAAALAEDPTFERPYGWAWLLALTAELALWEDPRGAEWRGALAPLEERVVDLVREELLTLRGPHRVGTHGNSAFALGLTLDYARVVGDDDLAGAVTERTVAWYRDDEDYPVEYEPLGWDFLSPALTEADLLRRVLDEREFRRWLDDFLPGVAAAAGDGAGGPAAGDDAGGGTDAPTVASDGGPLPDPVAVSPDDADGLELHLVGLNLARAWCALGVAESLADPRATVLEEFARRQVERGLEPAFTEDYAGAHWLTSFVLRLFTRAEGGIAPE